MFGLFSRKPKKPLTSVLLHEIESEFNELISHLATSLEISVETFNQEPSEARKSFRKARLEANAAQVCLQNVMDTWPDGSPVFHEIKKGIAVANKFIKNAEDAGELINSPSFSIFNPRDNDRYKSYVAINRQLGAELDIHLGKTYSLLKDLTGLELRLPSE